MMEKMGQGDDRSYFKVPSQHSLRLSKLIKILGDDSQ
jgi:hypothetical protein